MIVDVGATTQLREKYDAKRTIDATNRLVMPGLIDVHGHQGAFIKAIGDALHVGKWANMRSFVEYRAMTEEDFYVEGLLAALERLKFGTTCGVTLFQRADDPVFALKNIDAVREVGIRGVLAVGSALPPWPKKFSIWRDGQRRDLLVDFDESLSNCEKIVKARHNRDRTKIWLTTEVLTGPAEFEPLIDNTYRGIHRIAKEYGTGITTHCYGDVKRAHEQFGILSSNMLLVHCPNLTDEEIEILRQTDAKVAHCPGVICTSGYGGYTGTTPFVRVTEMIDTGVTVALGSDGPIGRITTFDMFKEMRAAMALQRIRFYMPPGKLIEMATIDAARALGLEKELGSIEPGKKADIVLLNMFKPHLIPNYMMPYRIVFEASGHDVETVMVDGEIIMEDRVVRTVDEPKILEKAQRCSEQAIERAGIEPFMREPANLWGRSKY